MASADRLHLFRHALIPKVCSLLSNEGCLADALNSTKGIIPDEAQAKPGRDPAPVRQSAADKALKEEMDSEDEEVDADLLKRGELEG